MDRKVPVPAFVMGFLLLVSITGARAGEVDPGDALLYSHELSAAEVRQFSTTDGRLSAFWENWEHDSISLYPRRYCHPDHCGFDAFDRAEMTVKSAYTERGLYVCVIVSDQAWVERPSSVDWGADAVDLFFDSHDSKTLDTCADCRVGPSGSSLSACSMHLVAWMEEAQAAGDVHISRYNAQSGNWSGGPVTFESLAREYGIRGEVVTLGRSLRAQEWYFPWPTYGCDIEPGSGVDGRRLAFSCGYNDKDGSATTSNCLRWMTKDPLSGQYWGDIELGYPVSLSEVPVMIPYTPDPTTDRTPTLTWHPARGARNYKVVIDDQSDFSSPIVTDYTGGDTTYTPSVLMPYGRVYWKVSCNTDYTRFSEVDDFVVDEIIRAPVIKSYPYDSTTNRHPSLSWHEVNGATKYHVMFDDDPSFSSPFYSAFVNETEYAPRAALPMGRVYWRVASDRDYDKFSDTDDFVVFPFGTPRILEPEEMAVVSPEQMLVWSSVRDPSSPVNYRVWLSLTDDFSSGLLADGVVVSDTAVPINEIVEDVPRLRMVFWRVQASNEHQESGYSSTASFSVSATGVLADAARTLTDGLHIAARPGTRNVAVDYSLRIGAHARIDVFDISGARVARLIDRPVEAGVHRCVWNGARAGVYIIRLSAGDVRMDKTLRLVR